MQLQSSLRVSTFDQRQHLEFPDISWDQFFQHHAAGMGIGGHEIWVCIPGERDILIVCVFGTYTADLHTIGDWLQAHGIQTVAMESTSVYWIPIIAHQLLIVVWQVFTKQQPYKYYTTERIAFKYLYWSWQLDEDQRRRLTRPQFARYYLMRLGIGDELQRVALDPKHPHRLATVEQLQTLFLT